MTDEPDSKKTGFPDYFVVPNEESGSADIYTTALTDEQSELLLRDLKKYKKQLRHDDPVRRIINLRLQALELLERTGCRIEPVATNSKVGTATRWANRRSTKRSTSVVQGQQ